MYVGRIVGAGRTAQGHLTLGYRVSSRSFPNREARHSANAVMIVPRPGSADAASDSPYIGYECLLWNDRFLVASNGTQTRPIFERLKAGNTPRDALVLVLVGLDREFDALDTPRICALADLQTDSLWLAAVTATGLAVTPVSVAPGQMAYLTTYHAPLAAQFDTAFTAQDATTMCRHVVEASVFGSFEHPICATAAMAQDGGVDVACLNIA
jgi:IMP cyclohydrolase